MNYDKVAALLENRAFAEKLFSLENAEAVQAFLKDHDVELTIEEILQWIEDIRAANAEGEMNEEDLDNVAGGALLRPRRPGGCLPLPIPRIPFPRWNPVW